MRHTLHPTPYIHPTPYTLPSPPEGEGSVCPTPPLGPGRPLGSGEGPLPHLAAHFPTKRIFRVEGGDISDVEEVHCVTPYTLHPTP